MVKIDASSQTNVCNIEIKKSKNIFSKHNHYTVTIEGIKHHYIDKPLTNHDDVKKDTTLNTENFTPIKLSENKINDTALIFSKMCAADKTYKPVEFIEKMVQNGNVSTASAILINENLSNEQASNIIQLLSDKDAAKVLDEMNFETASNILSTMTYDDKTHRIIDKMTFNKTMNIQTHDCVHILLTNQKNTKIIEKMCYCHTNTTANIISAMYSDESAPIISKLPEKTAANLIETMVTYKLSETDNDKDIYLSIDKAVAILTDKNLPIEKAAKIIAELSDDVAAEIVKKIPANKAASIFSSNSLPIKKQDAIFDKLDATRQRQIYTEIKDNEIQKRVVPKMKI